MMKSNNDLLEKVIAIAKKAGNAILDVYQANFEVSYKEDESPLTLADRCAHHIIETGLKEMKTRFPILSEEGKNIPYDERRNWEYFWLVDPLDGTKEFIKRNGEFTVNIALIHKNKPILGVIYSPVKDLMYYAEDEKGAFKREGEKLIRLKAEKKAKKVNKDGFKVIVSRSHMTPEVEDFLKRISVKEKISAGSSLKFCLVAEGAADIYPRFSPTMEWDTAAGQAIVENAGGMVLNKDTQKPLKYNKENLLNPWFMVKRGHL